MKNVKFNYYYSLAIIFLGLVLVYTNTKSNIQQNTVEYLLITSGVGYLFFKYLMSKIILKHQNIDYKPTNTKRKIDDLIVNSSVLIFIPLLLELSYACLILFVVKLLPQTIFNYFGGFIQSVYYFNKDFFKISKIILAVVIFLFAFFYFSSEKYKVFKKYKDYIKKITIPFKVTTILLFFLWEGSEIDSKIKYYEINTQNVSNQVKIKNPTLTAYTPEKAEQIEKIVDLYAEYISNNIFLYDDFSTDFEGHQLIDANFVYHLIPKHFFYDFVNQYPKREKDVYLKLDTEAKLDADFNKFRRVAFDKSNQAQFTRTNDFTYEYKHTQFSEDVFNKSNNFYNGFKDVIFNDLKTISKSEDSYKKELIKFLIKDAILEYLPIKGSVENLFNTDFLNKIFIDKGWDYAKDQVVNSFGHLLKNEKIEHADLQIVAQYLKNVIPIKLKPLINRLNAFFEKFSIYDEKLKEEVYDAVVREKTSARNPEFISYEEGLAQHKQVIEEEIDKFISEVRMGKHDESFIKIIKERYPNATEEGIKIKIEEGRDRYCKSIKEISKKDIENLNETLKNPSKIKDFNYLKDIQSPGGIFIDKSIITKSEIYSNQICNQNYLPTLLNCPNNVLDKRISFLSILKDNDNQWFIDVILSDNRKMRYAEKINPDLFFSAYSFVYGDSTNPVLVDAFYQNKVKKFSFNKNILHDKHLMDDLKKADEVIFNILDIEKGFESFKTLFENSINKYNSFNENKNSIELIPSELIPRPMRWSLFNNLKENKSPIELSRIYDIDYLISAEKNNLFTINSNLFFSVVNKPQEKYNEISQISQTFNANKSLLFDKLPYLKTLDQFSKYQALIRSVKKTNINMLIYFKGD